MDALLNQNMLSEEKLQEKPLLRKVFLNSWDISREIFTVEINSSKAALALLL